MYSLAEADRRLLQYAGLSESGGQRPPNSGYTSYRLDPSTRGCLCPSVRAGCLAFKSRDHGYILTP
eukprot:4708572-Heterocapsa_arctica.AAC.1